MGVSEDIQFPLKLCKKMLLLLILKTQEPNGPYFLKPYSVGGYFLGWGPKHGFVGRTWLNLSPHQINPWKARLQIPSSEFQESFYYICFWLALTDISSHLLAFILFPISNYLRFGPWSLWEHHFLIYEFISSHLVNVSSCCCFCLVMITVFRSNHFFVLQQQNNSRTTAESILSYSDHRINLFE